jgi:hypothetical protein
MESEGAGEICDLLVLTGGFAWDFFDRLFHRTS